MTPDERLEALLNRAGQTISDLPKPQTADYAYRRDFLGRAYIAATTWHGRLNNGTYDLADYILHLTDIIDRMETALENQVTLHEHLIHVIDNADIPEGVSYEQFCLVTDSIYKAVQTAQEGWESYEDGVPKDWSVDDKLGDRR